jgi:hypothetical protein
MCKLTALGAQHLYDPSASDHRAGDCQHLKALEEHAAKGPHRPVNRIMQTGAKTREVKGGSVSSLCAVKNILQHACVQAMALCQRTLT